MLEHCHIEAILFAQVG